MNTRRNSVILLLLFVFVVGALVGLVIVCRQYVAHTAGDTAFLPQWAATRTFLIKGQSPYSEEAAHDIQKVIYGRNAAPWENPWLFIYPFYAMLVFGPIALIKDLLLARALWMALLIVSLFVMAGISISLSRWRISPLMLAGLLLFTVFGYYSARPVINGDPAVLCALFICMAFLAIRSDHDILAGFLLALASIKPQIVLLLLIFILVWAASHERWLLVTSTIASLVALLAVSWLLMPDWIWQNARQIIAYANFLEPGTPGGIFMRYVPGIGSQLGWVLTVFAGGMLLWEWRAALHRDFRWFLWTACLTLVLSTLVGIRSSLNNLITLYPAFVLVLAIWDSRWGKLGRGLVIFSLLFLFFGVWGPVLQLARQGSLPGWWQALTFFILPLFLTTGLYWVRWWATLPPRVLLEELRTI